MAIIFERLGTDETVAVDRKSGGKFYHAKLSALVNSSNMGINAHAGQDFGWRLAVEQQALIEEWEADPVMIEKVSQHTKTLIDGLTHSDFLAYLLYQQELGNSPERENIQDKRVAQQAYEARVQALKDAKTVEAAAPFAPQLSEAGEVAQVEAPAKKPTTKK